MQFVIISAEMSRAYRQVYTVYFIQQLAISVMKIITDLLLNKKSIKPNKAAKLRVFTLVCQTHPVKIMINNFFSSSHLFRYMNLDPLKVS